MGLETLVLMHEGSWGAGQARACDCVRVWCGASGDWGAPEVGEKGEVSSRATKTALHICQFYLGSGQFFPECRHMWCRGLNI